MVEQHTQPRTKRRHLAPEVSNDTSTLLWRAVTIVGALGAGAVVASKLVWESWYNEIKNTDGFRELRSTVQSEHNRLSNEAAQKTGHSAIKKFTDYVTDRGKTDIQYSTAINERMYERFGIVSGWKNLPKGTWQRLKLIGWNNKTRALITGFITTAIAAGGAMVLRENNRLWNRLDDSRQDNAQLREDNRDLHAELDTAKAKQAPDVAAIPSTHAAHHPIANDNYHATNDNSKPRTHLHTNDAEHHARLSHHDKHLATHA